jgi:hypothetical protein
MAFRAMLCLAFTGVAIAAAPPVPSELSTLLAKAGVTQPVAAWCRASFAPVAPGPTPSP